MKKINFTTLTWPTKEDITSNIPNIDTARWFSLYSVIIHEVYIMSDRYYKVEVKYNLAATDTEIISSSIGEHQCTIPQDLDLEEM